MSTFLRPLGMGEILDGAFTLYRRHFVVLLLSALLIMVPWSLVSGLWARVLQDASPAAGGIIVLLFLPLSLLMWAAVAGVLTRQIAQTITGGEVSVADGFQHAFRRLLRLATAVLLMAVVIAAVTGAVMAAGALLVFIVLGTALSQGAQGVAPVAALLVAIVLPLMLFLTAMFFAVVPAVVVEDRGAVGALTRSWRLARSARLRTMGVLAVSWLIVMLPTVGLTLVLGVAIGMLSPAAAGATSVQFVSQQLIGMIVGALTYPFFVGCMTLLYFDRRVRTEAYDVEALAEALPAAD